jgi:hypothetical protein
MYNTIVTVVSGRPGFRDSDVFKFETEQKPSLHEIQLFREDAESRIFFEPVRLVRVRVEEEGKNNSTQGR